MKGGGYLLDLKKSRKIFLVGICFLCPGCNGEYASTNCVRRHMESVTPKGKIFSVLTIFSDRRDR